ncbi:hypothetical protein [Planctobacterium marinum]|uniref:hypothetical protein n=1 Tax=Planctobacterium marinum TaxID=1631968 RepID=UPI001E401B72|nr:hypothetical protein [Planctobacterium marinum]MCC2607833.1 hypothetical protein [Planctobacterium marinum]
MLKRIFSLILFFFCVQAFSYQASFAHLHYYKTEGVLPEPYNSFSLEIKLNEESDDAELFELWISNRRIDFGDKDLTKLKALDLSSLRILTEMYRAPGAPAVPIQEGFQDWFFIKIDFGESYRVEWDQDGETHYKWGKDTLEIMVTMGEEGSINVLKLQ